MQARDQYKARRLNFGLSGRLDFGETFDRVRARTQGIADCRSRHPDFPKPLCNRVESVKQVGHRNCVRLAAHIACRCHQLLGESVTAFPIVSHIIQNSSGWAFTPSGGPRALIDEKGAAVATPPA
jgi:hypothetical protein